MTPNDHMVRNYKKGWRSREVNEEAMSSAISDVIVGGPVSHKARNV